jgi:hypothetical protein
MMKTFLLMCILLVAAPGSVYAGPIHSHADSHGPIQVSLHRAGHAVDQAWEAFHRAALGGTLESPAVQTKIEGALHEARALLVRARDAAEVEDKDTVLALTARIEGIANQIQQDSKRRKQ